MKKRSKKWWALTAKQRRHDKSVSFNRRHYYHAPRWFRRERYILPWKAQCKEVLRRAILDDDLENVLFPVFKENADWDWF